ncbi:trigger factor [Mycoplasmopsis mustelae]|uniref:Trigger factor n=1 Tax=Mycoplasmopsis mustelae TaxID=171289 RepID=A0A4V3FNY4_9BACT|nr:trigger factor [Mycoplasmopsis mustelae]TDV24230.1 trigger factor [Mycoplasmopsis mustelae]
MIKHTVNKEKSEVLVSTTIEKKLFDAKFNELLEKESKKVKVPGYRPGKAPKEKLHAYINSTKIYDETANIFLKTELTNVFDYIVKNDIKAGIKYSISSDLDKEGNLLFKFHFPLLPDFSNIKLGELKTKFTFKKLTKVDKKKILENFKNKLGEKEEVTDKKTKTQMEDTLNIDFIGFIDNEPFDGGEAEGVDLVLGSKQFIPGFEEQLVGKHLGWKGDIKVVFPENYFVKEYRSKEAIFSVKINKILRNVPAELNDEFFKKLGNPEIQNLSDLEVYLQNKFLKDAFTQELKDFLENVVNEVLKIKNVIIHPNLLKDEVTKKQKEFDHSLKELRIKRTEYLQLVKTTEAEMQNEFEKVAREDFKRKIVKEWIFSLSKTDFNKPDSEFAKSLKNKPDFEEYKGLITYVDITKTLLLQMNPENTTEAEKVEKEAIKLFTK